MQEIEKEGILEVPQQKKTSNKLIILVIIGIIAVVLAILIILGYAYFTENNIPPANVTNNGTGINNSGSNLPVPNATGINGTTLLTNKTQNKTKPSGGGGGGGGSGDSGCTPSKDCSYYYSLNQCGSSLYDGCVNSLNCINCAAGKTCADNNCIELISCTNDSGCTSLNGVCGTGKCNLSNNECYSLYNQTTDSCRASAGECDAVEMCTGSSVSCPPDANKTNGAACAGGSCTNGRCIALVCGDGNCVAGENCPVDSNGCADNSCYEPICLNGCGQTPVFARANDEGCLLPMYCNGAGSCVRCITSSDCGINESCIEGNCVVAGQKYTLTIIAANGTVQKDPEDTVNFEADSTVYLIPIPNAGYCFDYWSGDITGKRRLGEVVITANKTVTAHFKAWSKPIGVPAPPFGITDTYRGYDPNGVYTRNEVLTYSASDAGGYYTHYVDGDTGNDSGNPYGTKAAPRKTIPSGTYASPLPSGSIIEIHGTFTPTTDKVIYSSATSSSPMFIRGMDADHMPTLGYRLIVSGNYAIFENLHLHPGTIFFSSIYNPNHVAVRQCLIHWGHQPGVNVKSGTDLVIYGNEIAHELWTNYTPDQDYGYSGIEVAASSTNVQRLWVVDNHIHNNGEDGYQSYAGTPRYVYIGRNIFHGDRENAVNPKSDNDLIVSQNICYHYYPSGVPLGSTSSGEALRPGDDLDWITRDWWIFNEVFDSKYGIYTYGTPWHVPLIGNIIHDLNTSFGPSMGIGGSSTSVAFWNTLYNTGDYGFEDADNFGGNAFFANNIVSKANIHAWNNNAMYNNLWYNDGGAIGFRGTGANIDSVTADPLFVNPTAHDFHVQTGSPAIGTGLTTGVIEDTLVLFESLYGISIRVDYEGNLRPATNTTIGAYEYASEVGGTSVQSESVQTEQEEQATLSLSSQIYGFFKGLLDRKYYKRNTEN